MKRFVIGIITLIFLGANFDIFAEAKPSAPPANGSGHSGGVHQGGGHKPSGAKPSGKPHHRGHRGGGTHIHGSYYVSSARLVGTDCYQEEHLFADCNRHSMISDTNIYFYSDGTRRSYTYYTIIDNTGGVIISGLSDAKHVIYNNNHFFLIKKNNKYKILSENGEILTKRDYTKMSEIEPNKLLVRANKKYGIIDLAENTIIPIKYKSLKLIGKNIFLTNLNGYHGIIDTSNNILVKSDCEKIKQLYDTFLLKRYGKFGLADLNGHILYEAEYDKIKTLGEYIVIKKDKKYGVLNSLGEEITPICYKKIKLERNSLMGKTEQNNWEVIEESL